MITTNNIDELNEQIACTVRTCTEEVCPELVHVKKKEPWEDAELIQQLQDLRKRSKHEDVRKLQKEIKKKREKLKNEYYWHMANEINNAATARDVAKEFALAKKYTAIKSGSKLAISNEKLKNHFEQHFGAREPPLSLPPELAEPEKYPFLNDRRVEINEDVPDESEVKKIQSTFKNNKSAGTDKLKTEGLKYNSSESLTKMLVLLMTLIWTLILTPSEWLHATINCLYKKGIMSDAKNYRGLSIGANMSRMIAKIIIDRFKLAYEANISEAQFGFRQNRSTSDAIFILKTVIDKYSDPLIAVYIDLSAAYDHIPRDFLFRVLLLRTGAKHLVAILRKMYEGTTASIRGMKVKFDVLVGCRQGGQESPCLFNYYFDYVLKIAAHAIDQAFPDGWGIQFEYQIPYMCSNRRQRQDGKLCGIEILRWILYADDLVLFCKSVSEAEKILGIINDTCKRFGLTISFSKTKTQVFNDSTLANLPSLFSVDGNVIENVKEFTYLGQLFTTKEKACFTDLRTSRAIAKFNELRTILSDRNVNLRTRRKIVESCVRSRLTYGTQAFFPNELQLSCLERCWNQLLRNMVGGGWKRRDTKDTTEEKDFAFVYSNADVAGIVKTLSLRDFVYTQYLRYIGHICRMPNTSIVKKLLFASPIRKNYRNPWLKISELLGVAVDQAKRTTQSRDKFNGLIWKRFNSTL